jgi:hypothetical protein
VRDVVEHGSPSIEPSWRRMMPVRASNQTAVVDADQLAVGRHPATRRGAVASGGTGLAGHVPARAALDVARLGDREGEVAQQGPGVQARADRPGVGDGGIGRIPLGDECAGPGPAAPARR